MNKLSLILLVLLFSCKRQDENKKASIHLDKYHSFYDKTVSAIEKKDAENFQINYNSTKKYLDSFLTDAPNNVELLRQKLGLLMLNNDLKEMINTYEILLKSDSLNMQQKQDLKFGRFYCMALTDSIFYKKQMLEYYKDVEKSEPKINLLLDKPDPYTDQPEIYKRMKLSYYFDGRTKTINDFRKIADKIPYKFQYDIIKGNTKNRVEFLKNGMDFPIEYNWE